MSLAAKQEQPRTKIAEKKKSFSFEIALKRRVRRVEITSFSKNNRSLLVSASLSCLLLAVH